MLNLTASLPDQNRDLSPQITVIGVGGAGCNAVNNMIASKLEGVRFISCNTDAQALKHSLAPTRMQLGTNITAGLGAGSKPEVGRAAAEESIEQIIAEMQGANMVFITAGMGGGTGTGAAPVIARAAKEAGILTVGVVTKPFHFEGANRMRMAEAGLSEMQDYVDTLIVIPNQNLFRIANEKTTFADAFKMADSVLQSGVRGVTDLMVAPGLINLDFADVRCAMMEMGKAMMGTGEANGERRAVEAAERAINNPLLDDISMKGAKGVIINITGGYDMTLFEVDEACNRIRDEVDADANIIFGSTFDESLDGIMRVTVLATGIETEAARRSRSSRIPNTVSAVSAANESRVQPQQQTYNAGSYGSASGMQSQLVVPPMASQVSAQPQASARVSSPALGQPQEPVIMRRIETAPAQQQQYQQAELGISVQSQQAPVTNSADMGRAVRHAGAFIPPRPVDPEAGRGFGPVAAAPQESPFEDDNAFAEVSARDMSVRPSSLQLHPPVPGSKKRAPSLFDKIAGMFSESDDEIGDTTQSSGQSSAGGLFSGFGNRWTSSVAEAMPTQAAPQQTYQPVLQQQAQPAPQSQPQQNLQADLEIPAFLRRQVS